MLLELRRRWYLKQAPPGPLRDYLANPFPPAARDYRKVSYLALDLETTGLNQKKDHILSLGWVQLQGDRIDLHSACHRLIYTTRAIPESSAVIHQITDDQAATGEALTVVIRQLLDALAGKVLIAHHAAIEVGFLRRACRTCFGGDFIAPVIDTQRVAIRTLQRRQIAYRSAALRLQSLREQYHLPRYGAHHALNDALAAAELFLAQAAYKDGGRGVQLRDFLW